VGVKVLVISNYQGAINPIRPEAEIFLGMHKLGVELCILTPTENAYYVDRFREAGIEVIDFQARSKFNLQDIRFVRKLIKERGFEVVHCFKNAAVAISTWACIGLPVKLLAYRGYTGNIYWYDPSCYLTYLNPRVDYITCLADSVKEVMQANLMNPKKAVTINKGHDPAWYDDVEPADLSEFNFPEGAMVCSFVANSRSKMKGLNFLIESTHHWPEDSKIFLLLIGNDLADEGIQKLVEASPMKEQIVFAGFRKNANQLVKACDVAISVSIFGEATQKAMIEAMYLGRPVLITDISGNRNMAENGKSGLVIPPKDPKAIAQGLKQFWKNPEERKQMGQEARKRIANILSIEKSVKDYKAFYEQVANEK